MKHIGRLALMIMLIIQVNFAYADYDDITNLFINAQQLKLNAEVNGELSTEYDIDCFTFEAPITGYYTVFGSGQLELRGHLYNSDIKFMRTGNTFREKNVFFLVVYLQKNEQVYLKVDSTVREMQAYKVTVTQESLPFNKVNPLHSKVETLINPNEVKTIKIPLSFWNDNIDVGYISKAYTYLMQINSNGKIQGQAGFNTDSYELELDIYGETDAVLTISFGDNVTCQVSIKAIIHEENDQTRTEPLNPDVNNNEIAQPQNPNPIENPIANTKQGDCNLDSIVDINDVVALLDVNQLSSFNEQQFNIADVTSNGIVDFTDALIILRKVTGFSR